MAEAGDPLQGTEPSIDEAIAVVEAAALIGTMQQIAADLETMMRSLKLAQPRSGFRVVY